MFRLGQPSRLKWTNSLLLLTACSGNTPWYHDAGSPYDAGPSPVSIFPRITMDSGRADSGLVTPPDGASQVTWERRGNLPSIDEYTGDHRRLALISDLDEQPCVAMSNENGLYFGCLVAAPNGDTGHSSDAGHVLDSATTPAEQWDLDRLSERPNNSWIGSELDAIFDEQGRPWVVARQSPERTTHLYHRDGDIWHHEEVPVALGGMDPKLHVFDDSIVLIHGSAEHHEAPALIASRRIFNGTWTHRRLIENYDAQPGRLHRSRIANNQISVCSFEPASQRITWGTTNLTVESQADAGPLLDTSSTDTPLREFNRSQTVAGGPFCDLDADTLYYNQPLLGRITKQTHQDAAQLSNRYGPFVLIQNTDHLLVLSAQDGRLVIGKLDERPFDLGSWTINDRPLALSFNDAVIVANNPNLTHQLEFTVWEPAP